MFRAYRLEPPVVHFFCSVLVVQDVKFQLPSPAPMLPLAFPVTGKNSAEISSSRIPAEAIAGFPRVRSSSWRIPNSSWRISSSILRACGQDALPNLLNCLFVENHSF